MQGAPLSNAAHNASLILRVNELQAENFSIRSRLNATVEELQVAQRHAAASSGTHRRQATLHRGPDAKHGRSGSVEVIELMRDDDEDEAPGMRQEIASLKAQLQAKSERLAQAEKQLQSAKAPSSPHRRTDELEVLKKKNSVLSESLRLALEKQGESDREALLRDFAWALDENKELHRKVEVLSAEVSKARLAVFQSPPTHLAGSGARHQDDETEKMRIMFEGYGKPWCVEEVERLLQLDEDTEIRQRLEAKGALTAQSDSRAHVEQALRANRNLREELVASQENLMAAHRKIDELSVALEAYSKYQDLQSNKAAESAASESARQAANEIAFLCDTLAATRAEAEHLSKKLAAVSSERDNALSAVAQLQAKSEELLRGCDEMATSVHVEAEASIQSAQNQIRVRERELSILRGELLAVSRQLDEHKQLKGNLEHELIDCRTKLLAIKETCATARNEVKAVKQEKQVLAAQVAATQKLCAEHQERNRLLEMQLATLKSGNQSGGYVEGSLARHRRRARMGSPLSSSRKESETTRTSSTSPGGAPSSSRPENDEDDDPLTKDEDVTIRGSLNRSKALASPSRTPTTSNKRRTAARHGGDVSDADEIDYRAEYAELKECFVMLLPMVPGALTARDVAAGLRSSIEKVNNHCKQLENELRKKLTSLQQLKKAQAESDCQIEALKKKVSHAQMLEKKLENKDRLMDKARRDIQQAKDEEARLLAKMKEDASAAYHEKLSLEQQLHEVRQELVEGKEVMMQLLRESVTD